MCQQHAKSPLSGMAALLAASPRNWGRWGDDDEVGALNFLGNAEVLAGVACIRSGKVITCGERIGSPEGDPIWPGRAQPRRYNTQDKSHYQSGTVMPFAGGAEFSDDKIDMFLQGSTQYDAIGHVWFDDQMYNGYPASDSIGGMQRGSILPIAEKGIAGRGVLLDMAAWKGKFALEKGDLLYLDDILGAAQRQGVELRKRDILCLRIGFLQLRFRQPAEEFFRDFVEPGLTYSPELVQWFSDMEIAALCTDTISNETQYDPAVGVGIPLHGALLRNLGISFNELCNFEKLAEDCHNDGQWDFLYTAAPLKIVDGCGAPVNVLVIK